MPEFIIKYWVEWLFGLLVAAGGFIVKRYIMLERKERETKNKEMIAQIEKKIEEERKESSANDLALHKEILAVIESMQCIKDGMLSIQGKQFKKECERILEESHEITLEEYEQLTKDHEVYNALGGNHNGDLLFELVQEKAKNQLTTKERGKN